MKHQRPHGQSIPEYCVIFGLIGIVCLVSLQNLGTGLLNQLGTISNANLSGPLSILSPVTANASSSATPSSA